MNFTELVEHQTQGLLPYAKGRKREILMIACLHELALRFNKTLDPMYCVDSNGEISLVASPDDAGNYPTCGVFGDAFAALMNKHSPRCGIFPTKHFDGVQGWCRMKHFDIEKMLNEGLGTTAEDRTTDLTRPL